MDDKFTWRDWLLLALGGVILFPVSEALIAYFRPFGVLGSIAVLILLGVTSFSIGLLLWGPWRSRA